MIMDGYGVVPQFQQILAVYWGRAVMAARVGGYYRDPFQDFCGVT